MLGESSESRLMLMDPVAKAQPVATLATMSATFDNIIQTTGTWNQRLEMVATCVTPTTREVVLEFDSTTQLQRSSTQPPHSGMMLRIRMPK